LLDLGVEEGFVKKSGSFYSYGETRLGQGREASRKFLKANTDIRDQIEAQIRNAESGITPPGGEGETVDASASN